jgi:glutaminyl-peptide cyclotransferase
MSKKRGSRPKKSPAPKRSNRLLLIAITALAILIAVFGVTRLTSKAPEPARSTDNKPAQAQRASYEVVASFPHDPKAFLQGLVWHDGGFYESTGRYGESSLRRVEFPSGKVIKQVNLAPDLFGEGLALVDNRLIQLTWTTKRGFVYDRETFQVIREFTYPTEGWGLTYDGKDLIMSDGSDQLTYLDAQNFQTVRKLRVTRDGRPVTNINELEFIEGEIWANVWHQDVILRIDPATGQVTSFLDMREIIRPEMVRDPEAVLNGIAYDPQGKRIFISGKLWPAIFEIRLK